MMSSRSRSAFSTNLYSAAYPFPQFVHDGFAIRDLPGLQVGDTVLDCIFQMFLFQCFELSIFRSRDHHDNGFTIPVDSDGTLMRSSPNSRLASLALSISITNLI